MFHLPPSLTSINFTMYIYFIIKLLVALYVLFYELLLDITWLELVENQSVFNCVTPIPLLPSNVVKQWRRSSIVLTKLILSHSSRLNGISTIRNFPLKSWRVWSMLQLEIKQEFISRRRKWSLWILVPSGCKNSIMVEHNENMTNTVDFTKVTNM